MNERKILVANSKTQQRTELQSAATTLGELKAELTAAGIDYSGMTFTEGFSKTQLLSDDSLLPTNVTHRGQVTNDLVILLTNTTKKIASGMEERSRTAAYSLINSLNEVDKEDVKEAIKEEFGRNYTQVTTEDLWAFLDNYLGEDEDDEYDDQEDEYNDENIISNVNEALKSSLGTLQEALAALNAAEVTVQGCISQLTALVPQTYQLGGTEISDNEINDMIAGI